MLVARPVDRAEHVDDFAVGHDPAEPAVAVFTLPARGPGTVHGVEAHSGVEQRVHVAVGGPPSVIDAMRPLEREYERRHDEQYARDHGPFRSGESHGAGSISRTSDSLSPGSSCR